jgi:hypothetical protein
MKTTKQKNRKNPIVSFQPEPDVLENLAFAQGESGISRSKIINEALRKWLPQLLSERGRRSVAAAAKLNGAEGKTK